MSNNMIPVNVHIFEREYRIACPPSERDALVAAAAHVDRKMKELRDSGKVAGTDRIAVMVALNAVNEMLRCRWEKESQAAQMNEQLRLLQQKIETVLTIDGQKGL